jgi:3-phosphoglycerate kinase
LGKYGGKKMSLTPLQSYQSCVKRMNTTYTASHFSSTPSTWCIWQFVENQYTMLGGIGIHHHKHTIQPKKKLVSIVAALLDVTIDDAFGGYGRQ